MARRRLFAANFVLALFNGSLAAYWLVTAHEPAWAAVAIAAFAVSVFGMRWSLAIPQRH